jgi:hypothetical protein
MKKALPIPPAPRIGTAGRVKHWEVKTEGYEMDFVVLRGQKFSRGFIAYDWNFDVDFPKGCIRVVLGFKHCEGWMRAKFLCSHAEWGGGGACKARSALWYVGTQLSSGSTSGP